MPHRSPSSPRPASSIERPQRGLSLIELVIFIAIVGVAVAGILTVYNHAVRGSADPLVRKQAVAVAESLLAEVLMQPFTWCDPQDPNNDAATPPSSSASCTGGAAGSQDKAGGALGPQPAGESRLSIDRLDNVGDYHGYTMPAGITDTAGAVIAGLEDFTASVAVTRAGGLFGIADDAALRVDVTVSGRGQSVTLTGYRFRHSPNATG